jgi:hypothetical protein
LIPEEEYFGAVAEVNNAYLKSITGLMKLFIVSNSVYFLDIASGISSPYEEYMAIVSSGVPVVDMQ